MKQNENSLFIFYLTLNENLPSHFYHLDIMFKEQGFFLIPVTVDQLQKLASLTEQSHLFVISSVSDTTEFKLYNDKVRELLKYILKSNRITFIHLSSFSKLNDSKVYSTLNNYFFLKYPLDARTFSAKVVKYYGLKSELSKRWPGGHRERDGEFHEK
jgi:hypothetical protein